MTEGDSNTTDSDRYSETTIEGQLGMMTLRVETHDDLDRAVEQFERVWTNRVREIEQSEANVLRESMKDNSPSPRLGD